jgi:membrane protease subunit (stomatin/prohibitin family)
MGIRDFIKKQFIDVIHWTEPGDGILAWRFPMQDMEIQNGAKLTVRESQMAAFVNEGRMADVLAPGLYTLNTNTLPLLTNLMNWDKMFQSPFKSDVYFFSTRLQTNQRWGTAQPVTIRDKDFGAVRMRAFGIYSWRLSDTVSRTSKGSCAIRSSAACPTRSPRARCRSSTWLPTRSNWDSASPSICGHRLQRWG